MVHIGACEIIPVASYAIRATPDGLTFSEPFQVSTIALPTPPPPKWWADIVGAKGETGWSSPDGFVNMDDVQAAIQKFEGALDAPNWMCVDVDGEVPNAVINMTDIQMIVLAFEGAQYPFSDPANCP